MSQELEESRMPLWEHLDELRKRLVYSLLALFVGFCFTYYFSETLVYYLEKPLLDVLAPADRHLYFTGVADKFFVYFQVSLIASAAVMSPVLFYQLWQFVSPALYKHERRFVLPFVMGATFAFLVGLSFAYFIMIPYGYNFLVHFGSPNEIAIITLTEYFGLTIKILLGMGLIFELPVLIVLLAKFGIVKLEMLTRFRRHAMVASAVLAAIITPTPDAFTMIITMVPLYLLYEVSIIGVRLVGSPIRRVVEDEAAAKSGSDTPGEE